MIYALSGVLSERGEGFFTLDVGGVFFKVLGNHRLLASLPPAGEKVKVFCAVRFRNDDGTIELFGFPDREGLGLFEILTNVSGVGARTALKVLDLGEAAHVSAAIVEGDAELLSKVPGIGKKTAERIILELRGKIRAEDSGKVHGMFKIDQDVVDVLSGLGHSKARAREIVSKLGREPEGFEERLKEALRRI